MNYFPTQDRLGFTEALQTERSRTAYAALLLNGSSRENVSIRYAMNSKSDAAVLADLKARTRRSVLLDYLG